MLRRGALHDQGRGVARPRRATRRRRFAGCGPWRRRWRDRRPGSTRLRSRGRTRGDRGADGVEETMTHRACYACAAVGVLSAILLQQQHCCAQVWAPHSSFAAPRVALDIPFAPLRVFLRYGSTRSAHSSIDLLCLRRARRRATALQAPRVRITGSQQPARRVSISRIVRRSFAAARALAPLFCCRTLLLHSATTAFAARPTSLAYVPNRL